MLTKAPPKRRACDECRQRKLACSKDPDGCDRCKKENVNCNYSEQKTMGRPKKRQIIETEAEPEPIAFKNSFEDVTAPLYVDALNGLFPLPGSFMTNLDDGSIHDPLGLETTRSLWNSFGVGGRPPVDLSGMDFESNGLDLRVPSLEPEPALSSPSDSEHSPPRTSPSGPCSCLASMYLALAALQDFPTDIVLALKTVRGAAATASEIVWCPQCGSAVMVDGCPPIESFQNTMLLGTILPVIANGYNRLLKMIDDETEEADTAGQMKEFRFNDYGGLCGQSSTITIEAMGCTAKHLMSMPIEMPPNQWRTTVRALLRVDVYGHEQSGFKHKGLKDLVAEMEYRQRSRHEFLNEQIALGNVDVDRLGHGMSTTALGRCIDNGSGGCYEILKIAKRAIDALVIP